MRLVLVRQEQRGKDAAQENAEKGECHEPPVAEHRHQDVA